MQETIRQHYVPRTYLKHFSCAENDKHRIGAITKNNFHLSAYKSIGVDDMCLEKNIYSLPGATVEERNWVESLYSETFDKKYNQVYEILVDPGKKEISSEERMLIISTVISMYYRNASWNRVIDDMTENLWSEVYNMAKASGSDVIVMQGQEISIKNKSLDEILRDEKEKDKPVVVLSQIRQIINLIAIRSKGDQIMVNKLEVSDAGYLTSDNPVICENISRGHIMPIDPTNIFSMPIDKAHHLTIIPNQPEWHHTVCRNIYAADISIFPKIATNSKQIQNCQRFILGDHNSFKGYFEDDALMKNPDAKTKHLQDLLSKIAGMEL